jgi:hypothetical protein
VEEESHCGDMCGFLAIRHSTVQALSDAAGAEAPFEASAVVAVAWSVEH